MKGEDPFQAAAAPSLAPKERKQRQPKVDPEFVAFGLLLKDSLVYVYMALFVICQACSYVLIKVNLNLRVLWCLGVFVVLSGQQLRAHQGASWGASVPGKGKGLRGFDT